MSTALGSLEALYRYPVKSMLGESLQTVGVGERGIVGDRGWATRDEVRGGIRGAKKLPELMHLRAQYLAEPTPENTPAPQITLPSGESFLANDADAAARVSQAIDHQVTLWPIMPPEVVDHYRRGQPDHEDIEIELRATFARTADEPLPDLSKFPPEIFEYESPPGTYFDAFPLLLLSQQSLETLAERAPDSQIDVRRFRPNLVIDSNSDAAYPEAAWVGRRIAIGEVVLEVAMECPRCVMTTHATADLPRDPVIMRKLVHEAGGNLGVYASVRSAGSLRRGASVELLDT